MANDLYPVNFLGIGKVLINILAVVCFGTLALGHFYGKDESEEADAMRVRTLNMADDILNPKTSVQDLALKGYFEMAKGGTYVDGCRLEALQNKKAAAPLEEKQKAALGVTNCVLEKVRL